MFDVHDHVCSAADTRVSSYCMFIPHPGLPRHSGSKMVPHDLGYSGLRNISSDVRYRRLRTEPYGLDYSGFREISSDVGYRRSTTGPYGLGHSHLGTTSILGYSGSKTASYDSGLGGSRTASSDSVCGGSSTAATSAHSTSHLVEHYQKMTLQPHDEGKL